MWRNPNHPAPDPPKPPDEQGERLATLPRGNGVELRLARASYNGSPYLSLRVWERDQAGEWWPCKGKSVSIRMGEAGELSRVLGEVERGRGTGREATPSRSDDNQGAPRDDRPAYAIRGRPDRKAWDASKLAGPKPLPEFDEFNP